MKKSEKSAKREVTLDEIFAPRGIAVVGVSASRIGFAELVVHSLKEAKFPSIYPVNPKYKETLGLPCYPSITDIPGEVDHVVVNIPAAKVLTLLDECAVKGVKSVHFFTAGFSESGDKERTELEKEMLNKAKTGGFRIIGPNCVGIFVPKNLVVNHFNVPMEPGPVAFMSQSGGHAQNLPSFSKSRGIRFSKVVSYGNALDVDENELLEYFSQDPETEIIAAYIEGVKDGNLFSKALKKAAAHKPVVIYKGGRTRAGQRAAFGHTASMISSVAVFDALCRQMRTIQVYNIEEMIDILVALRFANPLPKGTGVALIGAGGGPSVLAGDEMEKEGLYLPIFSSVTQEKLKQQLPIDGSIFTNPLDTPNLATPDAVATATGILGKDPDIHMIVYHLGFHPISTWGLGRLGTETFLRPVIDSMIDAIQTNEKPILLALRPPQDLAGMEEFLTVQKAFVDAGLPIFYSLSRLARAMKRVVARSSYVTVSG
jgi:acyl-CoA synthetase (NDP forming)